MGTSSGTLRYHGQVDESMFDQIVNDVELHISEECQTFSLTWRQTYTEDLFYWTTVETVGFKGSVVKEDDG